MAPFNPGSYLIERMQKLDPPLTRDLTVERDLRVPMPDGVELLANSTRPPPAATGSRWR